MNKVTEHPLKNRIGYFSPLTVVTSLMVMLYITSNILAVKIIAIGNISLFDAGTITFPFAYMLGDVLAECWGYKTARKVVLITFLCNLAFILFSTIAIYLPYPAYMQETQDAFVHIFTYVPRIVISSLAAFVAGGLVNAKVLVKIKEKQKDGRFLFVRTIGSSLVGYIFDTVLFVLLAFAGTVPASDIIEMIVVQYFAKALIEACFGTPLAYAAVGYLKRKYGTDTLQQN